ncbi:MAG: cytochrome c [Ardenticatenaceae bacterium]|nr:cytochrome c [Ardenticatenaceae bacterium]
MKKVSIVLLLLVWVLVACGGAEETAVSTPEATTTTSAMGGGMGMGMGGGMMARHRATVPEEYAGLTNPIAADEESLARGAEIYGRLCVTCHGDGGMGDGPSAANIDPVPAPIAHTSQMLGDDYLFWRVTEGGHDFQTAMPSWELALDEQERWDVINYVRALGNGTVTPGQMMGGAQYDPAAEAAQRADMLAQAVAQGVLTQDEADTFDAIHVAMDGWMAANNDTMQGGMGQMQQTILDELVAAGTITQADADVFNDVHDRLLEAGLMQ